MTTTRTMDWTPRERLLAGLCVISLGFSIAAYFDFGGSAGAAPRGSDGPITSADIPKGAIRGSDIAGGTITSGDVRNGSLRAHDLNLYLSEVVGGPRSVPVGATDHAYIHCRRAGDRAISGGFEPRGPGGGTVAGGSYPVRAGTPLLDQWHFYMRNLAQVPSSYTAWITCLD